MATKKQTEKTPEITETLRHVNAFYGDDVDARIEQWATQEPAKVIDAVCPLYTDKGHGVLVLYHNAE